MQTDRPRAISMRSDDHKNHENTDQVRPEPDAGPHDPRERITDFFRSDANSVRKPVPQDELQPLAAAASRLDQLLTAADEQERAQREQTRQEEIRLLRAATGRLDRLLASAPRNTRPPKSRPPKPQPE